MTVLLVLDCGIAGCVLVVEFAWDVGLVVVGQWVVLLLWVF